MFEQTHFDITVDVKYYLDMLRNVLSVDMKKTCSHIVRFSLLVVFDEVSDALFLSSCDLGEISHEQSLFHLWNFFELCFQTVKW